MGTKEFFLLTACTAVPAAFVSWLLLFLVRRVAPRVGLVDRPSARKVHTHPTPLGGGLGVWAATLAILLLAIALANRPSWSDVLLMRLPSALVDHLHGVTLQTQRLSWILGVGTCLMVLGLLDDRYGVPWKIRLSLEILLAWIIVAAADVRLTFYIDMPWITNTLSVLWIVTLINVFNMLDNMDGLSGGVAAIVALMLATAMWLTPDPGTSQPQVFVSAMLLVLVGALLGFLAHNYTPARIFLGDAGAYFVGFYLAVACLLATFADYQQPRPHTALTPLCVMALPLYDLFTVLSLRLREGRSPFEADRRHFSHRLVDLGLSKGQAVLTIYLVTATCGLASLILIRVDLFEALLVIGLIACVLGVVAILESTGWWRGRPQ